METSYTEIIDNSPPIQPKVYSKVSNYQEILLKWNPKSIKKDALFYQFDTNKNEDFTIDLIPDACMNILFGCDKNDPYALLSGIFTGKKSLKLRPNTTYFGFKPYSISGIKRYNTSLSELRDNYTEIELFFPDSNILLEKLIKTNSFEERIYDFIGFSHNTVIDYEYEPQLAEYLTMMICNTKGYEEVKLIANKTGYSQRYCRDKFKECFGITLKDYSSIMRFQNSLKMLINNHDKSMTDLAYENGYFDQAHFTKNFKKYASASPNQYRENLILKNA